LKTVFRLSVYVCAGAILAAGLRPACAVRTQIARSDSFSDLAPGELHSVSLSDQGRLSIAPELEKLYRPDAEIIWGMAVSPDRRVFYGTGHEGKIFVTDRKGSGTLYLDTDSPEVTALLFHPNGKLYFGSSPDGKLWVCDKPGTATLVFETGEKYIWDLLADPSGKIIVATGPKGKIFKVDPKAKKGKLLFDSPDKNVLSLAYGPKGRLHAATQGKGRVYRWDDDRRTTPVVLFEAPDDEVRRIVIDPEGNIFAAVNSEVLARRVISPLQALLGKLSSGKSSKTASAGDSSERKKGLTPSRPAGRSKIYLIAKDGFVRLLWSVPEAPVHDMAYDAAQKSVVIAAGGKGKLFRLDTRGNYWIVLSVEEEQIFALRPAGKRIFLATLGPAAAYRLGERLASKGEYISPALNAGATVRWGALRREGEGVGKIEIETRTGNTKEPDNTWYEWKPVKWGKRPDEGRIQNPVARYLQWKAIFKAQRREPQPNLDFVEVFYVPSNEPPQVKKIEVKKSAAPTGARPSKPGLRPPTSAAKKNSAVGKDFKVPDHSNSQKFEIVWQVSDPNGDPLESALYFKGEGEKTWKLIKDKLTQTKYVFGTGTLPDGEYRIKVVVSDRRGNFAPDVRKDELVSDRFVVDNTPPVIEKIKAKAVADAKGKWHISARVSDATSLIAGAKYNIDGQDWHVLMPADGLFDDRVEQLEFDTEELKGEEHVLGLVVTDREGNSIVGKVLLRP